jgi:hypothetical protein
MFRGARDAIITAPAEREFLTPNEPRLRALEMAIRDSAAFVGESLGSVFPLTANTGPNRPSVEIPNVLKEAGSVLATGRPGAFKGPRSFDPMALLSFVDAPARPSTAAVKAGVPLFAMLTKQASPRTGATRVFKGAGGKPHEALRGGKFAEEFAGDPTTGEGAQAFGHGLYFAENPGVAKQYQRNLTDTKGNNTLIEADIDVNPGEFLDWDKPLSQQSKEVQENLKRVDQSIWDELGDRAERAGLNPPEPNDPDYTGGELVRSLRPFLGGEETSIALREAGIPGIRYLDEGSRSAVETELKETERLLSRTRASLAKREAKRPETIRFQRSEVNRLEERMVMLQGEIKERTRNIVLFDDTKVQALKVNGVPVQTGEPLMDLSRKGAN